MITCQSKIQSNKTDIYRQGNQVVIARTFTKTCPVAMLELYIKLADIASTDRDVYVFRNLTKLKTGYCLRKTNQPMSYSRVRELVLKAISPIVDDFSKFSLHSLRSGGASQAAKAGITDRLFKRHGRWISESAKDGYTSRTALPNYCLCPKG